MVPSSKTLTTQPPRSQIQSQLPNRLASLPSPAFRLLLLKKRTLLLVWVESLIEPWQYSWAAGAQDPLQDSRRTEPQHLGDCRGPDAPKGMEPRILLYLLPHPPRHSLWVDKPGFCSRDKNSWWQTLNQTAFERPFKSGNSVTFHIDCHDTKESSIKNHCFGVRWICFRVLLLPFTSCVNADQLFNFSEPYFAQLKKKKNWGGWQVVAE